MYFPTDDELVKKMKEKEQALNAKREELIKQEADKIRKAQPVITEASRRPVLSDKTAAAVENLKKEIAAETKRLEPLNKVFNDSVQEAADEFYKALDRLESLKSSGASKAEIKAVQAEVAKLERTLDSAIVEIVDALDFAGSKSAVKRAKAAKVKEIRTYIDDIVAERTHNESVYKINNRVKGLAESRKNALKNLDKTLGKDFSKLYTTNNEQFRVQFERSLRAENMRLEKLTKFKSLYEKAVQKSGNNKQVIEEVKALFGLVSRKTTTVETHNVLEEFVNTLSKEQKADFLRLVDGELDIKAIEAAINRVKGKISVLEASSQELDRVAAEIIKLGGEGAYIKKGVLYNKSGKKVKFAPVQISLTSGEVSVPKSAKLIALEKQLARLEGDVKLVETVDNVVKLTEEQIMQQARTNVTDDMVKAEKDALEAAKKAVEEKSASITPKTKEQLTKEFVEKNGTKDDAIKKAADSFKDDLKNLYEGKLNNKKLAGIVAGGIVIGALAGLMLKPKNKNA